MAFNNFIHRLLERHGIQFAIELQPQCQVRHLPRSGWLDEWGRLKGGRSAPLDAARCASWFLV
jgi:hypothetical protein